MSRRKHEEARGIRREQEGAGGSRREQEGALHTLSGGDGPDLLKCICTRFYSLQLEVLPPVARPRMLQSRLARLVSDEDD